MINTPCRVGLFLKDEEMGTEWGGTPERLPGCPWAQKYMMEIWGEDGGTILYLDLRWCLHDYAFV